MRFLAAFARATVKAHRCMFNKESKQLSPHSLGGLLLGLGLGVGELDVEFLGSLNDSESLGHGDSLGDLSAVDSVVHEQHLDVVLVGDQQLLEAIGEEMSGFLVLLVTNLHFLLSSSESSSGGRIDTSDGSVGVGLRKR